MLDALGTVAFVICMIVTVAAVAAFAFAGRTIIRTVRIGTHTVGRMNLPARRLVMMVTETLGHTRMLQWKLVGAAHWFVLIGFGALFGTLIEAYGELINPDFVLPLVGRSTIYGLLMELVALTTLVAILVLLGVRLRNRPNRLGERRSRFSGSTMWQAYYVEATIVAIAVCVLLIRALKKLNFDVSGFSLEFPVSGGLTWLFSSLSADGQRATTILIAVVKIFVSMAWFVVIALNTTMGVAWHRFIAPFNVFFKRDATGGTALGALLPVMHAGAPVDFEDPPEDARFGVGVVEDYSWKNLLDFTTCTECGRCQSQCPAWNTAKPLSPKRLVIELRNHLHAKAPYLLLGGGLDEQGNEKGDPALLATLSPRTLAEAARPLVGSAAENGVIDPDVLWSCTTCGACVQQCPVDIEHVDEIVDMRRYQVMVESSFPTELNGLFKNLENKGNPWGMNARSRGDWISECDFDVPVFGSGGEEQLSADVEYLFWVGCAGAYEDRAKKTTKAVAELLNLAGVKYAVLGEGEGCTGDPARRAGNEFLFQMLAAANKETLTEIGARRLVVTCPHCFNTLGREYSSVGIDLEVVHHTQLLNRLVREGRLTPVTRVEQKVTYHDPCYLGRHNQVYTPPRDLLAALPGVTTTEMPRNSERSFCCGAGGARLWMEEKIGTRINLNRVDEALSTGAEAVAVACPFCRIMVTDGVTARNAEAVADGKNGPNGNGEIEVLDVAQLLLRAVKPQKASPQQVNV